jgi:5-methyltetrahydropteroyltriglutamate--homocysteine methyltransferase
LACGVDVVNDGETEEIGYSTYVKDRLSGFDGTASPLEIADLMDLPGCSERLFRATSFMAKQYRGAREW